jgi:hypothetical protein
VQVDYEMHAYHKPAWAFSQHAICWYQRAQNPPEGDQGETGRLTLAYCAWSLEAFISEQLDSRLSPVDAEQFFGSRISVFQRWKDGTQRVAKTTPASQAAVQAIKENCDKGHYWLMVRSRNMLVHARTHIEIINDAGHRFVGDRVENLVRDLRATGRAFPQISPVFPDIVQSPFAARWWCEVMGQMLRLFHEAAGETPKPEWQDSIEGRLNPGSGLRV